MAKIKKTWGEVKLATKRQSIEEEAKKFKNKNQRKKMANEKKCRKIDRRQ